MPSDFSKEDFDNFLSMDIDIMAVSRRLKVSQCTESTLISAPTQYPGYVLLYDKLGNMLPSKTFIKLCIEHCQGIWSQLHVDDVKLVENCGPAVTFTLVNFNGTHKSFDLVWSLFQENWPSFARNFSDAVHWPSAELINSILSSGCHLVPVGCKESKFVDCEWRMSFSAAEIKLAESLLDVQRDVYTVFKQFMKVLIGGPKVFSTYCLKNIFFWYVQETPPKDWTYINVGKLFHGLLLKAIYFYKNSFLPHYFYPANNLIRQYDADSIQLKISHIEEFACDFVGYLLRKSQNKLMDTPMSSTHDLPSPFICFLLLDQEIDAIRKEKYALFLDLLRLNVYLGCLMLLLDDYHTEGKESLFRICTGSKCGDFLSLAERHQHSSGQAHLFVSDVGHSSLEADVESVICFCRELIDKWNRNIPTRVAECLISSLLLRSGTRSCCSPTKSSIILMELAAYVEGTLQLNCMYANSGMVQSIILQARQNRYKGLCEHTLSFAKVFQSMRSCLLHKDVVLGVIDSLMEEGRSVADVCNNYPNALCIFVAALHLAATLLDRESVIKSLCDHIMDDVEHLLDNASRESSYCAASALGECLDALMLSEHADERFVAMASMKFGCCLWNHALSTRMPLKELSENLHEVERHLEMAWNICVDEELPIYVLQYCRFLISRKGHLQAMNLLCEYKDCFVDTPDEKISFRLCDRLTVDSWVRVRLLSRTQVEFNVGLYRLYLLGSCYQELSMLDELSFVQKHMRKIACETEDDITLKKQIEYVIG